MGEARYFQFPLYALAYGTEAKQRLSEIISYCCLEVGKKESAGMTVKEKKTEAEKLTSKPGGFNQANHDHLALLIGMQILNVCNGNVGTMFHEHEEVGLFLNGMTVKHGPSPLVRIRNDLFWEAVKGEMDYRRFSVMCGVYAVIGSKDYCRVTRDRIRAGAMGYKSAGMMTPEVIAQRKDGAKPLTENQVRRTLDDLECSTLITRVQVSNRKVVFSNRLSRKEITEKVLASETKRVSKLRIFRKEDQELRASIKAVKRPERAPRINRTVTAESPQSNHGINHGSNRFNINLLIETPLTETSLKETGVILPVGVPHPENQQLPW